jgi:hypothetical protein
VYNIKVGEVMSADGQGTIYIPYEDWCAFVEKYAPWLKGTEYSLGPIGQDADEALKVEYAFSDEFHPVSWMEPPHWLKKEKK